jgi:tetratricopeptide (TPR) repeat protein
MQLRFLHPDFVMFGGKACGAPSIRYFPAGVREIKHAFFCFVLFGVLCGQLFAQEISPSAKRFYQDTVRAAEVEQKIRFLESALQASPQYLEARLELGKTLIQIGRYDEARVQLEWALDIDAQNAEIWYWKGRAYHALGDTATAARSYQRALKRNPRLAEAKIYLTKIENQPRLEALYQTAELARQAKDWRGAAENYQKILDEAPDFKDAAQKFNVSKNKRAAEELASAAEALRQRRQFDEAIHKLTQAVVLDNDRALEFREQIRRIERENKPVENRSKAQTPLDIRPTGQTPAQPNEVSTSRSEEDTTFLVAPKAGRARSEVVIAPKDSLMRHISTPPANKPRQNFSLRLLAAAGAIIFILTIAFIFRQKRRAQAQKERAAARKMPPAEPAIIINNQAGKSAPFRRPVLQTPDAATPRLERYRCEEELGSGGMGRVYKAYDRKLERQVAIKIIRLDNTVDPQEVEERLARFRREAKAIARLNHPNIVSLYDCDEADGMLYMVMEYVKGQSVEQMLNAHRQLSARVAVRIIKQACAALDYAHKNGVIHRDLKPSNMMLNLEEFVKVVDFGVAKLLGAGHTQMNTLTGMRLGSPFYMSPEQIEAQALDPRSDIYSLGAVFYEMLAGQKPFTLNAGDNLSSLFYAILHTDPPKLKTLRPEIPSALEMIVQKMLAKDRERRFATARDIIGALQQVV